MKICPINYQPTLQIKNQNVNFNGGIKEISRNITRYGIAMLATAIGADILCSESPKTNYSYNLPKFNRKNKKMSHDMMQRYHIEQCSLLNPGTRYASLPFQSASNYTVDRIKQTYLDNQWFGPYVYLYCKNSGREFVDSRFYNDIKNKNFDNIKEILNICEMAYYNRENLEPGSCYDSVLFALQDFSYRCTNPEYKKDIDKLAMLVEKRINDFQRINEKTGRYDFFKPQKKLDTSLLYEMKIKDNKGMYPNVFDREIQKKRMEDSYAENIKYYIK